MDNLPENLQLHIRNMQLITLLPTRQGGRMLFLCEIELFGYYSKLYNHIL